MQLRRLPWSLWLRGMQLLCTLGLAFVLWRSIDWGLFAASLVGLRWSLIALAALFLLFAHGFNIVRWRGLLPPRAVSLSALTSYYGAGLFSSNFLPTGVGGDAVRAALLGARVGWPSALLSVTLDRGIGLIGLSFFVVPGLWIGLPDGIMGRLTPPPDLLPRLWPLALLAVGAALGIGWMLIARRGGQIRGLITRLGLGANGAKLPRRSWRAWTTMLLKTYVLSVCSNLCLIAAHWAVLQALGSAISAGAAIWLVIIGSISLLAPISINGLGVLESVFVVVLAAYGVSAPAALAAALLIRALGVLFSLLGGLISLGQGWRPGQVKPDSPPA